MIRFGDGFLPVLICVTTLLGHVGASGQSVDAVAASVQTSASALPAVTGRFIAASAQQNSAAKPEFEFGALGDFKWLENKGTWEWCRPVTKAQTGMNGDRVVAQTIAEGKWTAYDVFPAGEPAGVGSQKARGPAVNPALGRSFGSLQLADFVRELSDAKCVTRPDGSVEVSGRQGDYRYAIVFDPARGWLATSFAQNYPSGTGRGEASWVITAASNVGGGWFPKSASYENKKDTAPNPFDSVQMDWSQSRAANGEDVQAFPKIPGGTFISADDNVTYRATVDGQLAYFGMRGRKAQAAIAWGCVFIISSATLLVVSLLWVFRQRRVK